MLAPSRGPPLLWGVIGQEVGGPTAPFGSAKKMAKKSQIARNAKRRALIDKHSARRAELKAKLKLSWDNPMARSEIQSELQSMPLNSSPSRYKNRCAVTGRSRGYMRKFGLSRITFREMASEGLLPGIRKASW